MADGSAFEYLSVPYANSPVTVAELAGDADLLMLGWVAKTIDWRTFFNDKGTVPIVWRLADLSQLTGGCHYPDQCTGFVSGCHSCPKVSAALPCKATSTIWKLKQQIFASIPAEQPTFVAQSKWLASLVRSSPLGSRFRCEVIPNGVDREVLKGCRSLSMNWHHEGTYHRRCGSSTFGVDDRRKDHRFMRRYVRRNTRNSHC